MPVENPNDEIEVRALVRWLGPQGAKAGFEKSKRCTTEVLAKLAESLGLTLPKSSSRQQLIDEIVRIASKRIEKTLDDLIQLSREDLISYLERVDPEREEILELLREIDAHPTKEGRRALIEFAARELSETGRFRRIASGTRTAGEPEKQSKS